MEEEYIKLYDKWNHFKKTLDSINITIPFFEKEIWSIAIGVNIDIEIDGKGGNFERPVLVIKKFNRNYALVLPITRIHNTNTGMHIIISHKNLDIRSAVVLSQLQRVSNYRFIYRIGILDTLQFLKIVDMTKNMLA